jgi:flagellar biosynthetic protein FliP
MFMTFLVMAPTWQRVNSESLQPYLNNQIDAKQALDKGLVPVRQFMTAQIERYGNEADVDVFTDAARMPRAKTWNDVPTTALIPAFMLSELKVAFTMGFRIFIAVRVDRLGRLDAARQRRHDDDAADAGVLAVQAADVRFG